MRGLDLDRTIHAGLQGFSDQGRINGAAVSILTVSFLVCVIGEWRKQLRGEHPDWSAPLLRLAMFGLLLASYSLVARSLIELVSSLGELSSLDPLPLRKSVFAARADAFSASLGDDLGLSLTNLQFSAVLLVNSLLDVVTYMTFTIAAACVFILKVIQKVMLSVLLTLGPLMIAFSSIPGLTSSFLSAWIFGVIEVSAWGITAKIFLSMLVASESTTTVNPNITQNLAEHIVFNIVYGTSFLVIPAATAAILRGGASSVAQGGLMSAKMSAIRAAGAAAGGAQAVSRAVERALKRDEPRDGGDNNERLVRRLSAVIEAAERRGGRRDADGGRAT